MKDGWARYNFLPLVMIAISFVTVLVAVVIGIGGREEDVVIFILLVAGVVGGVFVLYLLFGFVTAIARRRSTTRIVFGQIATVVRQNLPLATALSLAAESERGWARVHLLRIARLLAQGSKLSDAVRLGYPDCPSLPLSLIGAGERAGQLGPALDQAEQYLLDQAARRNGPDVPVLPYALTVLGFTVLVASFLLVAVIPKFKEIFKDFNVMLPPSTMLLIEISRFFAQWGVLFLLILGIVPIAIYLSLRPRHFPNPSFTTRIADWVRWHTPGLRRLEYAAGLSAMFRVMRLGVRSGMDLGPSARLASEIDVNTHVRPRMRRFAELMQAGTEVGEAARDAQLGEVARAALAGGRRAGDMDTSLRYTADYHSAILSRTWALVRGLAWPVGTLIVASFVAFLVYAMFLPLISLINACTGI